MIKQLFDRLFKRPVVGVCTCSIELGRCAVSSQRRCPVHGESLSQQYHKNSRGFRI